MKAGKPSIAHLTAVARFVRQDIVRMIASVQSGHPGGSLSIVEILVALYHGVLNFDPNVPNWKNRDRFILSKGHCAPALYAVLAHAGLFPRELLETDFRRLGGILQGHPDMNKTPGVDMTTGSLGIGLSAGCGMAMAANITGRTYRVYVLLGDGELNEGQVWEAAKTAAHHRRDNLTAMVDVNGYQNDGLTGREMNIEPLRGKWEAFGWNVLQADGHDFNQVLPTLEAARECVGRPTVILFRTVKGKGVSFMERDPVRFHGTAPDARLLEQALSELAGTVEASS